MSAPPRNRELDDRTSALVAGLRGAPEQRHAACTALLKLEAEHFASGGVDDEAIADIAVACASPLCEVLCKSVAEVSAEEYIRVAQVLTALCGVSPARVGGECTKQCWGYLMSLDSALGVALSKEPETLTADDALIVAAAYGFQCVNWASPSGASAVLRANGLSFEEWMNGHIRSAFLLAPPPNAAGPHQTGLPWLPSDRRNLALVRLFLDMLKEPEQIPEFLHVGVLFSISHASMIGQSGRPVVALMALEEGAIELLVKVLRSATSSGLFAARGFARGGHEALQAIKEIVGSAQIGGIDVTQQLLDSGFIDLLTSALRETEQLDACKTNACMVSWSALWLLLMLDGSALSQIDAKLRPLASTLRFLADSQIDFLVESGLTSGVFGTLIAANLFGKDEEENSFGLTQRDISHIIPWMGEVINPTTWGFAVPFHSRTCRPLLNLCTSDTAKQLLLSEDDFIPLLMEGLLLNPQHPSRKDADDTTLSIIQRDFSECIQQVSLFGPGCEALKANPDVVNALDTTVEKARSEEAKVCATAALKQLCPERYEKRLVIDADSKHIMMSYQWENQDIVKMIVADLQNRLYNVWWDLECMKGSLVDAMSEAVEGAELLIYGVSEKYKESANCRLELNYGMTKEVPMIPLMMQKSYKANGWLGLILGQSMWYAFYPEAVSTREQFKTQMDALVRAIGDMGKIKTRIAEDVPPKAADLAPAALFEPAPEPAPSPVPTLTAEVPPSPPHNPSANRQMSQEHVYSSAAPTVAIPQRSSDVLAVVERLLDQQRAVLKEQRLDLEARLDAKDTKLEQMRQEMQAKIEHQHEEVIAKLTPAPPTEAVTGEQLVGLIARFASLRSAELITDEELAICEDLVADYVELKASVPGQLITEEHIVFDASPGKTFVAAAKLRKLVHIGLAFVDDAAFARQVRRNCT